MANYMFDKEFKIDPSLKPDETTVSHHVHDAIRREQYRMERDAIFGNHFNYIKYPEIPTNIHEAEYARQVAARMHYSQHEINNMYQPEFARKHGKTLFYAQAYVHAIGYTVSSDLFYWVCRNSNVQQAEDGTLYIVITFGRTVYEIAHGIYCVRINGKDYCNEEPVMLRLEGHCVVISSSQAHKFLSSLVPFKKPTRSKEEMKKQHMMHLLQTGYTTASFVYNNSNVNSQKKYTFKVHEEDLPALKKHGLALVHSNLVLSINTDLITAEGAIDGYSVVKLVEVHDEPQIDDDAAFDYKWIVTPVNLDSWAAQAIKEQDFKKHMRTAEREATRLQARQAFEQSIPAEGSAREAYIKAMTAIGALPAMNSFQQSIPSPTNKAEGFLENKFPE